MTELTIEQEESIAQAIARCEAAQAAYDAGSRDDDDVMGRLTEAESDAIEILAETPCASDAEFLEKLRFLVACETRIFGLPACNQEFGPIAVAANLHFSRVPGRGFREEEEQITDRKGTGQTNSGERQ